MDGVTKLRRLVLAARAEDDSQNHLERELLHPVERGDATVPRAQLTPRELGDRRPEGAHARPVKRRLNQPLLAQMLFAVQHEDGVGPREGAQELPALAGGRDRGVETEDVAHRVRTREEHERLIGPVRADSDRLAEAVVYAS